MARPITLRQAQPIPQIKGDEPGVELVPKTLWSPPAGLDYLHRKSRIDAAHTPESLNLLLDRGVMRSRKGTLQIGAAAGVPVMAVVNFVTGSGIGFLIRFLTTKLQLWDGAAWTDIGGVFTGGTDDYWAYTAFNDTLLFSNNVDGLWEYAPLTGAFQQITLGPNARHLSTIGGRVVASAARGKEYSTEWSEKNNSHGWGDDFIGAGVEDLKSTPGGQVDQVIGTWPISEDISLMVRSNSIWQVTQTGDPEAPFKFDRLYAKLGSRSRHSVDVIPGGLIMLSNDDIYIVDTSKPTSIGTLIRDRIFETVDLSKAKGLYRARLRQYWLTLGGDECFVYSLEDQGWCRVKYPFDIRWLEESIPHTSGQTWDETLGTWDASTDAWDQLVGDPVSPGFYLGTSEALGNVIQEQDEDEDEYIQAGKATVGIEIQTPELLPASPLDMVQVNEAYLEYEAGIDYVSGAGQDLIFEFSDDGADTWNAYSLKTTLVTTRTMLLKPEKEIERDAIMMRLRSDTLGRLTIVSFSPMLVKGATRNTEGGAGVV